jgi:hypothetical protein
MQKVLHIRTVVQPEAWPRIREVCEQQGYKSPEICTPSELTGGPEYA